MSENLTSTPTTPERQIQRVRAFYARLEALRYVGHLEMQHVWERTLRRAGTPLIYSQGFNPNPKLHMASALPLGFLSRCEIIDFWMNVAAGESEPNIDVLAAQIRAAAPPGLCLLSLEAVAQNLPPLQTLVESSEYEAVPYDPTSRDTLLKSVTGLLAEASLPRERRGKPYDLRPLIETLEVPSDDPVRLRMRLAAREGATGRPEEVLDALGLNFKRIPRGTDSIDFEG